MKRLDAPVLLRAAAALLLLVIAALWVYSMTRKPVPSAKPGQTRPSVKAATDVNKDGKSDLLWRNAESGIVYRFFMSGLALGEGGVVYTEKDPDWMVVADADFNGDGVVDLLWRNRKTGLVFMTILSAEGTVAASGPVYHEPNTAWRIVQTPDLDGDGKADLLYWNATTGQLFAVLMDGLTAGARGIVHTERDTEWRVAAVGDFAGSGKRNQLIYHHRASGQVYLMTVSVASGRFSQSGTLIHQEPDTAWKIMGAADFNGDGKTDLLWRNETTGDICGMLMTAGPLTFKAMVYPDPDPAWHIVAQGDYNGDGKADLLWRQRKSGQVLVMLMDGLAIAAQGVVYKEPNITWRVLGPSEYAMAQ
jgi:peptidyl-Asp metalloendopeptidase